MSRRIVSDEEKTVFRELVEQIRPQIVSAPKPRKPRTKADIQSLELDGNTKARLKDGNVRPQARKDLHGLTQSGAHAALLSFLESSHKKGLRLVLVVTGKGNPDNETASSWSMRERGALKEMVPRWLREPAFAELIAGATPAHDRHGGGGALYVYLRKSR